MGCVWSIEKADLPELEWQEGVHNKIYEAIEVSGTWQIFARLKSVNFIFFVLEKFGSQYIVRLNNDRYDAVF